MKDKYNEEMRRFCFVIIVYFLLFLPSAYIGGKTSPGSHEQESDERLILEEGEEKIAPPAEKFREEASRIALSMDDSLLAAQCLLAGFDNKAFFSAPMQSLLQKIPAAGIILFRYNLTGTKDEICALLKEVSGCIAAASGVPPFMAVDHEGGMVHRFGRDFLQLPAPAFFWEMAQAQGEAAALRAVEEFAWLSGRELWELGINLNLAPVAETLSPLNQAFLETRSYGPDPVFTEKAASAFIRGMGAAGIICTVKHFPGNSAVDPHDGPTTIEADSAALDIMIQSFRNMFQKLHVPALMISHAVVPIIDPQRNASLSPKLISIWLREELGFSGITLADDFSMKAVSSMGLSPEEAAVEALNAGVDLLMCWPSNMASIHGAILSALKDGRLPRQRLEEAAERIIAEKARFGIVSI